MKSTIQKLKQLKDIVTNSGKSHVSDTELKLSDIENKLRPFSNIENAIDREIRKLETSGSILKRNSLS